VKTFNGMYDDIIRKFNSKENNNQREKLAWH
jgi:hypothetical protein